MGDDIAKLATKFLQLAAMNDLLSELMLVNNISFSSEVHLGRFLDDGFH